MRLETMRTLPLVASGLVVLMVAVFSSRADAVAGLVSQWKFDEGAGSVAHDASGSARDAAISGAAWVKQGAGWALSLDGIDDYVECTQPLPVSGPVTLEAWVKPTCKGNGEASLLGEGIQSYLLTYYNTEVSNFYVNDGSNSVRGQLELGGWNHVMAAFDGKTMSIWVNGRLAGTQQSKFESYKTEGKFAIGTKGQPELPKFKGSIDNVRVYNRALADADAVAHFKAEAAEYGFDPTWFSRVKVTPYYYLDRGRVVLEADYKGIQPFAGQGKIQVKLAASDALEKPLFEKTEAKLPAGGSLDIDIPVKGVPDGKYVIQLTLEDEAGKRPVEKIEFDLPAKPASLPSPASVMASRLPAANKATPFDVVVGNGGGFTVKLNELGYTFRSRISWPNGEFNELGAEKSSLGEKSWKSSLSTPEANRYEVEASGNFYSVHREIKVFPTHVYVHDTYTNRTDQDLGLLIYNEMPVVPGQLDSSRLSGHEKWGRRAELSYPDYSPSVFVTDPKNGIGIVPMDDVYSIQSVTYVEAQAAGVCTEKFALPPKGSYTLEWAVYPTGSKDYYDFVNAFRKVEGRVGKVDGGFGFVSYGPMNRRQIPDEDFFRHRGMKYGIISCLSRSADDPEVSVEGIEFLDFPKEMDLLKQQAMAFHHRYPDKKLMFHIAPSLYMTNQPERFADSKVMAADGKQAVWGASEPYVTKRRQAENWTWWVYYPTLGNSFRDLLLKSIDVMMDDIGMDGAFMDGFFAAYSGLWTYDGRWDGHSAEIDPKTKTITRKIGSVLLLSQQSMIDFARKVRDKGGVVIANNTVITRSIANEKYIYFVNECASGPELHLAPSVTVLGRGPFNNEKDIYLDMLDKLSWGELFSYYSERINLTQPSLAARQYPITFEEIRPGMVRGKERIVTMNSGVYAWGSDRSLHLVHKFDARGAETAADAVSTADSTGVRTELKFHPRESAVIERIPATLDSAQQVNVLVSHYDDSKKVLLLNGNGDATLQLFVGTDYPDKRDGVLTDGGTNPGVAGVGAGYKVTINGDSKSIDERDGTLSIPMKLQGETRVSIEREQSKR